MKIHGTLCDHMKEVLKLAQALKVNFGACSCCDHVNISCSKCGADASNIADTNKLTDEDLA